MAVKLLVFDSHPVQYRVPVWRQLNTLLDGSIHVVYGSDCSVRGHEDAGFGRTVAWDDPMLEGYNHTVLNCEKGKPLSGWSSLTGEGVEAMLDEFKPEAVLLTGLNYRYDHKAYRAARKRNIPVWLRCETQDEAGERSFLKSLIRSVIYRIRYLGLSKVFYIGELNKQHYLRHGVSAHKLIPARYGTVDRFNSYSEAEKNSLRIQARSNAGIADDAMVVGFSGKFIAKKNPDILFSMLPFLPAALQSRIHLYFIGSGEMEKDLKQLAAQASTQYGVKTYFPGFINQTELPAHYLAIDILVLPSRKMGETWGLVTNEAMQAGCSVITTTAVGSSVDFKSWSQFRAFPVEDSNALAKAISELAEYPRTFDWATEALKKYSLASTAEAIAAACNKKK